MVNNKLVDITGLSRYHENLKGLLNAKQDNIEDLDVIRSGAAAGAESLDAAKEYVDSKVDGKFDAAGAAAQALADAKADAAELYQVKGEYEAAGTAAGLNDAMDLRVKALEAIDHEKLASDASAAAVATVLDGAPEKFDTLKEVAEWIAASDSASSAADLVTRVAALEAIDHDAYVDADTQVLADAKVYADGLASNYDAAGAADQALADAKADAASLYQVKGDYEAAGAAAQALVDAKSYVDDKVDGKFDAAGDAAQALADAKTYVDGKGYITANDLTFAADSDIDALFE